MNTARDDRGTDGKRSKTAESDDARAEGEETVVQEKRQHLLLSKTTERL